MTPHGWIRKTVSAICETVSVGIVVKPAQYYTDRQNGIKAFRSANIKAGKIKDANWVYISAEGHEKNHKSRLQTGDVLVVRSGAPGTSCVVTENYNNTNCIDIVFARPNKELVCPDYLSSFTNSDFGKREVARTEGGLALKHFNVSAYKVVEILLPPLEEQNAIIRIFSTWDDAIEKTEQLIAAKEEIKKCLMQRILTEKVA